MQCREQVKSAAEIGVKEMSAGNTQRAEKTRMKKIFLHLGLALALVSAWHAVAFADIDWVNTNRGCGSNAVYYVGEEIRIDFYVDWAIWFQGWEVIVYDAGGSRVDRRSGVLLPFFYYRGTFYVKVREGQRLGEWQIYIKSDYTHSHTCYIMTADGPARSYSSRSLPSGQSHLWKLSLTSGAYYTIVLGCESTGNKFRIEILDGNMRLIRSTEGWCAYYNQPLTVSFAGASGSNHYVRVTAASGSGQYHLRGF
jgi:hypothetical protein